MVRMLTECLFDLDTCISESASWSEETLRYMLREAQLFGFIRICLSQEELRQKSLKAVETIK